MTAVSFTALALAVHCWLTAWCQDAPAAESNNYSYSQPLSVACCPAGSEPGSRCSGDINAFGVNPWDPCCRYTRYYRSYAFGRLWFGAELLGWSTKGGSRLPPLVTASPGGTSLDDAGVLGLPTTTVLLGDTPIFDEMRIGGRLTGGWWIDLEQTVGIEGSYFGLDGESVDFRQAGDGVNILARPFFNVGTGQQDARLVAFPTTTSGADTVTADGTIDVRSSMQLSGAEAICRRLIGCSPVHRYELVAGYRYGRLKDDLVINEEINITTEQPTMTTVQDVGNLEDAFRAVNDFHGGELGFIAHRWWNRVSLKFLGKVALGGSNKRIRIEGRTVGETTTTPAVGDPTVVAFDDPFGLLAQPSNIGAVADADLAVLTEFGVDVEYLVNCQLKFTLGYTFLYWSDVARVMDQIDLGVDPTQAQLRPRLPFATTDFWAQGLRGGLVYLF